MSEEKEVKVKGYFYDEQALPEIREGYALTDDTNNFLVKRDGCVYFCQNDTLKPCYIRGIVRIGGDKPENVIYLLERIENTGKMHLANIKLAFDIAAKEMKVSVEKLLSEIFLFNVECKRVVLNNEEITIRRRFVAVPFSKNELLKIDSESYFVK